MSLSGASTNGPFSGQVHSYFQNDATQNPQDAQVDMILSSIFGGGGLAGNPSTEQLNPNDNSWITGAGQPAIEPAQPSNQNPFMQFIDSLGQSNPMPGSNPATANPTPNPSAGGSGTNPWFTNFANQFQNSFGGQQGQSPGGFAGNNSFGQQNPNAQQAQNPFLQGFFRPFQAG